jgi:hypothetical protein
LSVQKFVFPYQTFSISPCVMGVIANNWFCSTRFINLSPGLRYFIDRRGLLLCVAELLDRSMTLKLLLPRYFFGQRPLPFLANSGLLWFV